MRHIKCVSTPCKASHIVSDPAPEGESDGTVEILDTVFGFVLDLVTIKGKGSGA